MNRQNVQSSNLRSVGYDAKNQLLEIQFHSGGVYRYFGVPESVYQGLLQAQSKGSYFGNRIRDVYKYKRIR